MKEKAPLENLVDTLNELVDVYPDASTKQKALIDSLFKIGSEQIKEGNFETFATNRIEGQIMPAIKAANVDVDEYRVSIAELPL